MRGGLAVLAVLVILMILMLPRSEPYEAKLAIDAAELRRLVDLLLDAALVAFPGDPGLLRARQSITHVDVFDPLNMINIERKTVRRGKYDRNTGTLLVATVKHTGTPLPAEVVAGVLVHEVAHAAVLAGAHSDEWQAVYVKLLGVATEQLGWRIALECSACPFYGLCQPAQCPKCTWKACQTKSIG